MSNVSIAHTVTKFDAKLSQALTGQRLAKCRYKTTAKQSAKYPSVCVSVPYIDPDSITANIPALVTHIRYMLENAQDGIIRSLYETSDGALSQVTDTDLSIASCISFMEAESEGTRLTKEFIESWFDSSVKDYVYTLITEKLGYGDNANLTVEQDMTVCKHVNGYRGMYSALAGGKTMYQPNQINSLKRVLDIVDTDDTQVKLLARLNKMLETPKIEDLLEL